jgi:hypothetical protein
MFCPQCGHQNPDSAKFCMGCGFSYSGSSSETQPVTPRLNAEPLGGVRAHTPRKHRGSSFGQVIRFGFYGAFIGSFIGYLLRPSAPLVGQLPLTTVLTRGSDLRGINQILIPLAQTSFNYIIVGIVLGWVIGAIAGLLLSKRS